MRTFSVTRREERKARECSLCLCRFLISYLLPLVGGVAFSPSEEKRETQARAQKKEREKREFSFVWFEKARLLGRRRRSSLYIFIREYGAAITA